MFEKSARGSTSLSLKWIVKGFIRMKGNGVWKDE